MCEVRRLLSLFQSQLRRKRKQFAVSEAINFKVVSVSRRKRKQNSIFICVVAHEVFTSSAMVRSAKITKSSSTWESSKQLYKTFSSVNWSEH